MDENTKHLVASNLTVAYYTGQGYRLPFNDPESRHQADMLEPERVFKDYERFLTFIQERQEEIELLKKYSPSKESDSQAQS